MSKFVFVCTFLSIASLAIAQDPSQNEIVSNVYTDCIKRDSTACLKYRIYKFMEGMAKKTQINITNEVQIVKDPSSTDSGRSLNSARSIEDIIWNRVQNFIQSHTFKFELKGSDVTQSIGNVARSISGEFESGDEESRGYKKKVKKLLGPLMTIGAFKSVLLLKLAMATILFIAGKALIIGKIAFMLAAIVGLKKLFGGNDKKVSYEVVTYPVHINRDAQTYSHDSTHEATSYDGDYGKASSGWSSASDGNYLAYKGYASGIKS